ncbi:hypothetical protein CT19425_U380018 [Cupriavidus taiwanensis]|uniref:Uncharacterized protein n=1 Tax=Cupriavidus taiwanensis TaxID=164546 RepID=A0A375I5W0_9BURK|nr:hypothetical protein CT19425_U230016 [Cupriavidus taiwanensis]SPK70164.1 hypothetical protein CT19425_U380018 [Cupriavidus taiwanensis]
MQKARSHCAVKGLHLNVGANRDTEAGERRLSWGIWYGNPTPPACISGGGVISSGLTLLDGEGPSAARHNLPATC